MCIRDRYQEFVRNKLLTANHEYKQSKQENKLMVKFWLSDAERSVVTVSIFYPRQFEALRWAYHIRLRDFLNSLSTSTNWAENTGGKSNAVFLKTHDNVYVVKMLGRNEFKMLRSHAPTFFAHYWKTAGVDPNSKETPPSLLSKIFGIYEVRYARNRLYYIVMENLFFGLEDGTRPVVYDLKGSETNRFLSIAAAKKNPNQVLLDNNFRLEINGEPLPLKEKDYRMLLESVKADASMLAKLNIVDYSLLVILDKRRYSLRLGIIDYLRVYTWDKQIEHVGKRVLKAGQTPTIVNPNDYKERLLRAMEQYFMAVFEDQ
eukprot:TRINITY_DN31358_c0_g1_i2.p2 TRINITY_DN31358_c0_g1~~TRINITY_DN31358_c0_g1_i2.p2  ORF type:complete len:317 (+),score=65.67 TRINITY_DN31358_c0_g1_i2:64-1014(+)